MIYVSSVTLNKRRIVVQKGRTYTLTATVLPENATNKNLKWTTTDSSIATVSNGVVTGKKAGSVYIEVDAMDGSFEGASCFVEVTNDVLVTRIDLNASSLNMSVGDGYILQETINPQNATNCRVHWSSSDYRVATVDPDAGFVMAVGGGTAVITATANDGSGVVAKCVVTVDVPIPVEGVEICPEKVTMSVGDTKELSACFIPTNASDQIVTWRSSNEEVATVSARLGEVTANKPGTTTITATTNDGGFKATREVKVKDLVTIERDGAYNKVVFNSTGKVWKCINEDMIFNSDPPGYMNLIKRSNYNFYRHLNENGENDGSGYKEYSDNEIKLLYAIDPHGVCDYINRYVSTLSVPEDKFEYKNEKFELLFNRKPKYFARNLKGKWGEVSGFLEVDDVLSESELLFGGHKIWDDYAMLEVVREIIAVVDLIISVIPQLAPISTVLNTVQTLDVVFKIFSFAIATASDGLLSTIVDSFSPDELLGTSVSWANTLVSSYMDLLGFLADAKTKPNCYTHIFGYYIDNLSYDIEIEFSNGEICDLERIRDALNMDE